MYLKKIQYPQFFLVDFGSFPGTDPAGKPDPDPSLETKARIVPKCPDSDLIFNQLSDCCLYFCIIYALAVVAASQESYCVSKK